MSNEANHPASVDAPAGREALLEAGVGSALPQASANDALRQVLDAAKGHETEVAVRDRHGDMSFGELLAASRRWATRIGAVKRSGRIAIVIERSREYLPILFGCWWASRTAVPLDGTAPDARLRFMVEAADAAALVCDEVPSWAPDGLETLRIVDTHSASETSAAPSPGANAYVIFTSGSTGMPKGVEVSHAALAAKLASIATTGFLAPGEVVFAHHALSADISLKEVLAPLVARTIVYMATGDERELPDGLKRAIERVNPDVLGLSPTGARMLVDSGWRGSPKMRLGLGGEKFPLDLARKLLPLVPRLTNGYGPTEACIECAQHVVTDATLTTAIESIPFGRPMHDVRVFVLRADRTLADVGEVAELAIGGAHVANGYVGRDEETAAKFIQVGVAGQEERVYLTGDHVRWTRDLQLEFMGRVDEQVKLFGTRIEMGEISHALRETSGVKDAIAAVVDGAIVGYLVSDKDTTEIVEAAKSAASSRLPALMRPVQYMVVDAWPMTSSGKLDRTALEKRLKERRAPNVRELILSLLKIDEAADDASLADIGAHSLFYATLRTTMRKRGKSVSYAQLYGAKTLAELCELLEGGPAPAPRDDAAAPLPAASSASPEPEPPSARATRQIADRDMVQGAAAFELFVTALNRPGSYGADAMWFLPPTTATADGLVAAWSIAAENAPALRARVEGVPGGFMWRISSAAPRVEVERVTASEPDSFEEAVSRRARAHFEEGVAPLDSPLVRPFVFTDHDRVAVAIVYHRLLLDRDSARRAIEAWVAASTGKVSVHPWVIGAEAGEDAPTAEYREMLASMDRIPKLERTTLRAVTLDGRLPATIRAWARLLRGFPPMTKFMPKIEAYESQVTSPLARFRDLLDIALVRPVRHEIHLTRDGLEALARWCRSSSLTPHAAILGALSRAVAQWTGDERAFPTVTVLTRPPDADEAIGLCSASIPTVLVPKDSTFESYAHAASHCIQIALAQSFVPPKSYESLLKGPPPWTQFVYHGINTASLQTERDELRMIGSQSSANALPQFSYVDDGTISVLFDAGRFDERRIRRLLEEARRMLPS